VNNRASDRREKVKYAIHMLVAGLLAFLFLGIMFLIIIIVYFSRSNFDINAVYVIIFLSGIMCLLYFGLNKFLKSKNLKID
jgi:hypothetical protein